MYDQATTPDVPNVHRREGDAGELFATRDIIAILWRGRWLLLSITFIVTGLVAAASLLITPKYDATVLLMPVADQDSPDRLAGIGSAASQLGGLASLAGLSTAGNTFKAEAVATLESEALTERYIQENDLLPVLYASKWDAGRKQWKSGDSKEIPTLWKANRFFRDRVRGVVDNPRTGLIAVTISWRNPRQAAKWANDLVKITNEDLRRKAIEEANRSILFLEDQGRKSNVISLQEAIANLTEAQLRKVMLAQSREQYALKVIDPATVPEKQSYPQPAIWIPAAFFIGIFLGTLAVLLKETGTPLAPPKTPARLG